MKSEPRRIGRVLRSLIAGGEITALVVALLFLSTCTTGLLDLVSFQVLSNETGMLFLGYPTDDAYGVAKLATSTGAMEILRTTVAPAASDGCAIGMDPRPLLDGGAPPEIYYTAESPNRVMRTDYRGLDPAEETFLTDPAERANCVRVVPDGLYLTVFWSTTRTLHRCSSEGEYGVDLGLPIAYIVSFDVDPDTYRIYYLGLPRYGQETAFGVYGIDSDGSDPWTLVTLGRYVRSNLLLLGDYLYYVTQEPDGIYRIRADGTQTAPTLVVTPTGIPEAIAVDPESGDLYWIEIPPQRPRRIMHAAAGETTGESLIGFMPKIDWNGFFFYGK